MKLLDDLPRLGLIVVGALLVVYFLHMYADYPLPSALAGFEGQNQTLAEDAGQEMDEEEMSEDAFEDEEMSELDGPIEGGEPMSMLGSDEGVAGLAGTEVEPSAFPSSQLSSDQLLPSDRSSVWADAHPEISGPLAEQDFLSSGHLVGINTQGSSLRNANRQLRSEPPAPQVAISPWNQTTITYDVNRRPLEIQGDF